MGNAVRVYCGQGVAVKYGVGWYPRSSYLYYGRPEPWSDRKLPPKED